MITSNYRHHPTCLIQEIFIMMGQKISDYDTRYFIACKPCKWNKSNIILIMLISSLLISQGYDHGISSTMLLCCWRYYCFGQCHQDIFYSTMNGKSCMCIYQTQSNLPVLRCADKIWVGQVKLLCITMFNISQIRPKSLLGPVKAIKICNDWYILNHV